MEETNNLQVQNTFVKDLNQFLLSNAIVSRLIVGGDWNVALCAIDKKGGIPWRPTTYRFIRIGLTKESTQFVTFSILMECT